MNGIYEGGLGLTWTLFFPEAVGPTKVEFFYGWLVATLRSLPGRWPCTPLLCIRADVGWCQTLSLLV
jgi:hypothetical protein